MGAFIVLLALAFALQAMDAPLGVTYYVDYAEGNNAADGLSPSTAWKQSPGDVTATGVPAGTVLRPGDVVRFRGGVRYLGTIRLRASGTPAAPIVFDGSGWGDNRAVFDGSEPVGDVSPCRSAEDCLGAPNWKSMVNFTIPVGTNWSDWLFGDDRPYVIAQFPTPPSALDYDDVGTYAPVPLTELANYQQGRINQSGLPASLAAGQAQLVLWSRPNVLLYASSFTVDPEGISFVEPNLIPYPDRTNRYSVMNTPAQVVQPGQFALAGNQGRGVAWLHRDGASLRVGTRRNAFVVHGANWVTIRGFVFTNYSGLPDDIRAGVPILTLARNDGLTISQNIFRGIVLTNGYGAVHTVGSTNLTISGNSIVDAPFSSGIRVGNGAGPVDVSCNRIDTVGRTGIYLQNVKFGRVRGNYVTNANGVHGNAISLYLDNRQIEITDNVVHNSIRPMTIRGPVTPYYNDDTPTSVSISRNVLVGNTSGSAALISWGGMSKTTITDNTLAAPRFGIRINDDDKDVSVSGNQIVGSVQPGQLDASVNIEGNLLLAPGGNGAGLMEAANAATVPTSVCPI